MLHVLTVHYRSADWIDVQLAQLRRHLTVPYRVVANLEGIDDEHHGRFDLVVPSTADHAEKLNLLAEVVCAEAEPEDLLMFLDGDAFPVGDPLKYAPSLKEKALVAVRRDENDGDPQPHPCFALTTVGAWRRLGGDWSAGYEWAPGVTDVGGNLLSILEASGESWLPVMRTSGHRLHPLWFGIYGRVIYHHGAGFREVGVSRADERWAPKRRTSSVPVVRGVLYRLGRWRRRRWLARAGAKQAAISEDVKARVLADPQSLVDWLA